MFALVWKSIKSLRVRLVQGEAGLYITSYILIKELTQMHHTR